MVRRCSSIILSELESDNRQLSANRIAESLWKRRLFLEFDVSHLEKILKTMLDHGSRYRNIQRELGEGAVLVLGKNVSETM